MKINPRILIDGKEYNASFDIEFNKDEYQNSYVRNISKCHVDISYRLYDNLLSLDAVISGVATLACCYTLQDVDHVFEYKDSVLFCDDEEKEDEDILIYKGNVIDLKEYLLSLVLASLPSKIIKPGASLPKDGEGYRVLSEEEFEKESHKKPSPFDVLAKED